MTDTDAEQGRPREYSEAELLDHLHDLAEDGVAPSQRRLNEASGPSHETYHDRFGSYRAAAKVAGLEPASTRYTEAELLDHLRDLADDGVAPTSGELRETDGPWPGAYRNRFGSLPAAAEKAGVEPQKRGPEGYSDEELLSWIRAFAAEFGVAPATADMDAWPGPCSAVYRQRFGSIPAAVERAGHDPRGGDQA